MRKKYKRIISFLMCCGLTLTLLGTLAHFMEGKRSYAKNVDFYKYSEDYDVLFLGSSRMTMGVFPMELWNDYGITSYNLANYGQWLPVDYWVLKNALEYATPKLVVIDVYFICSSLKYSEPDIALMHDMFDSMPLKRNKVEAVVDLLPRERRMEFLFDFSFYHSRWDKIDSIFHDMGYSVTEKGANMDHTHNLEKAQVTRVIPTPKFARDQMDTNEYVSKEYLRKIIEMCQEKEIDVLLTALPCSIPESMQVALNSAYAIAEEYDIAYLDLIKEDAFINYYTDFFDEAHLNSSGAKKTTHIIGEYISKNYALNDWRESYIAPRWNQDFKEYKEYKLEWLKQQNELDAFLMLLSDKEYNIIIQADNFDIFKDLEYVYLFENLGIDTSKITRDTDIIIVCEGGKDVEIIDDIQNYLGEITTPIGELELKGADNSDERSYDVFLDGEKCYTVGMNNNIIQFFVIDKDSAEISYYIGF